MKRLIVLIGFLAVMSGEVFAAGNDTLAVYASDLRSLDQIINSDTTTGGLQAHDVYKLVSLDTTYLYLAPIMDNSQMTIVGALGADGRPPCIQPGLLPDQSEPSNLITVTATGGKLTLKDVYYFGMTVLNTWGKNPSWGQIILVPADSAKIYLNHVVADQIPMDVIDYSGNYDDYYITHCIFRNGVWPNNWFSTMVLNSVYPASSPVDTVIMDDNTLFCLNSDAMFVGVDGPTNYVEFDHNTFAYNFQFTFQFSYTVWNLKITNNIFYGVYAAGVRYNQYHYFYYQPGWAPVSAVELDTMRFASGWDTSYAHNPWLAESKQKAVVSNNDFFEPQKLTQFWTNWNDTATTKYDSLITCVWLNPETQNMFTDKTHWPGYMQSNNLDGIDPGFGSSLAGVLDGSGNNTGVGLLQYIREVRTGIETTDNWGYNMQTIPANTNWVPQWPLPETADMKYSNTAVEYNSSDGLPLGDPSWFGITPGKFSVLSKGDSYTASVAASSSYPDPNGTKLTDGVFAPDTGKFSDDNLAGDPAWVGYHPSDTLNVVIDLGKVMPVQQFAGDYLMEPTWGIFLHPVNVSVSTDGVNYTFLDSLHDNNASDTSSTAGTIHKFYLTLQNPVNARYVKFSTLSKQWVFVDEYQVLSSVATAIQPRQSSTPAKFELAQNYPNPFNPSTTIQFSVPNSGTASLKIYNVLGQLIATVYQGMAQAHRNYTFDVSMDRFASGVYFYTLKQGSNMISKKMLLLK